MGRKRTRARELIHFCVAGLIFFAFFGCAVIHEKQKVEVKSEESQGKNNVTRFLSGHLLRARELLKQQDYDGSFKENERILSLSGQNPPGDEALFNMGLIYAHPGNPKKDYGKSVVFFKKLMKDYPQTPFVEQANIWVGMIQENEKLTQTIEKLNEVIGKSNQTIEKSISNYHKSTVDIVILERSEESHPKSPPGRPARRAEWIFSPQIAQINTD